MTSEISKISVDDAIIRIKELIENQNGDKGRLNYILKRLNGKKSLLESDKDYLERKIFANIVFSKKTKITGKKNQINDVKRLISFKFGDQERLNSILIRLNDGKQLFKSDNEYLKAKIKELYEISLKRKSNQSKKLDNLRQKPKLNENLFFSPPPNKIGKNSSKNFYRSHNSRSMVKRNPKHNFDSEKISKFLKTFDKKNNDWNQKKGEDEMIKLDRDQMMVQRENLAKLIDPGKKNENIFKIKKEEKKLKTKISKIENKQSLIKEIHSNKIKINQLKSEKEKLFQDIQRYKTKVEEELVDKKKELSNLQEQYLKTVSNCNPNQLSEFAREDHQRIIQVQKNEFRKSLKGKIQVTLAASGFIFILSVVLMRYAGAEPCDVSEILNIPFFFC